MSWNLDDENECYDFLGATTTLSDIYDMVNERYIVPDETLAAEVKETTMKLREYAINCIIAMGEVVNKTRRGRG